MKKCMKYRVEGRRPVGRPRKTWLESVEADMVEHEIDKEDVHDRSKWRRNVNVMKRKSNQGSYIPGYESFLYTHANVLKDGQLVLQ